LTKGFKDQIVTRAEPRGRSYPGERADVGGGGVKIGE